MTAVKRELEAYPRVNRSCGRGKGIGLVGMFITFRLNIPLCCNYAVILCLHVHLESFCL